MRVYKTENYIHDELSFHMFDETINCCSIPLHTHEFTEIIYATDGEGVQSINGVSQSARRGDLFFINRESTHAFSSESSFSYYNICFSPETVVKRIIDRQNALDLLSLSTLEEIQTETASICKFSFNGNERVWIEQLLKDMLAEYTSNQSERNAILESYMTILIAKILRKIHAQAERKEFLGIWHALSEFIDENLTQKLTLKDLASKCFYNPSYFSRAFKQKFGMSPVEYITQERARMAAKLLAETTLSIEDVAEHCGFGEKTSLYNAFKKHYGCSPTEYKKSLN